MIARRRLATAVVIAAAAACSSTEGPQPGTVTVSLAGPAVRAVQFNVVGPVTAITIPGSMATGTQWTAAPRGGDTLAVMVVAPLNGTLNGQVVALDVPDVPTALARTPVLVSASSPTHALVPNASLTLTIVGP